MDRQQSVVSAIVGFIMVVIAPWLYHFGIVLDENTVTTIVLLIVTIIGFGWTMYKNHNFTMAAQWAQSVLDSFKIGDRDDPDDDEEIYESEEVE